jgi:short-subunit dehydrogenase
LTVANAASRIAAVEAVPCDLSPAVVVSGGSAGIGLAIARRFAADGRAVLIVARDPDRLARAAAQVHPSGGGRVLTLSLDVTDPLAPAKIDAALAEHKLFADVLVNSAGIGLGGRFDEHSREEVDRLVAVNVAALTRLMHHALQGMRRRGRGGVINLASLGGFVPGPYQAAYYASKAYVVSLSEAVAAEVAADGVRVCAVAPGPVETRFHRAMGAHRAMYKRLFPSLTPDGVARSAVRGFILGRRVVVPGILPEILRPLLVLMPHTITLPIVAYLLAPGRTRKR